MSGDTTNRDFVSFRLDQAKTDNALSLYVGSSTGSQVIQEAGPVLGPFWAGRNGFRSVAREAVIEPMRVPGRMPRMIKRIMRMQHRHGHRPAARRMVG